MVERMDRNVLRRITTAIAASIPLTAVTNGATDLLAQQTV
jgi:hypothetical protein